MRIKATDTNGRPVENVVLIEGVSFEIGHVTNDQNSEKLSTIIMKISGFDADTEDSRLVNCAVPYGILKEALEQIGML